jgi:hypothetical protein
MHPEGPFSNITGSTFFLWKMNAGGTEPQASFTNASMVTFVPLSADTVC